MPITKDGYGNITVTGDSINTMTWLAQIGIVSQVAQGHRRAPVQRIAAQYNSDKRTSKGILEDVVLAGYNQGFEIGAMWGSVTRALGADRAAKLRRKSEKALEKFKKEQK